VRAVADREEAAVIVRRFTGLFAGAALVVLAATACGGPAAGPGDPSAPPSELAAGDATIGIPEGTPTVTAPIERMPASWRACDKPTHGFSIGYPGDWHTAEGEYRCLFFHPEPFMIPANSEFPPLALNAGPTGETVATYRGYVTDPMYYTVVRDEDVTVLDRPGVRYETVTTGQGLDEAGVRRYGYIIDSGSGQAFAVWTVARPAESRYDNWKFTVDIAKDTVRFLH
jgi:hypothetical protein